jgi:hypothetical protein
MLESGLSKRTEIWVLHDFTFAIVLLFRNFSDVFAFVELVSLLSSIKSLNKSLCLSAPDFLTDASLESSLSISIFSSSKFSCET